MKPNVYIIDAKRTPIGKFRGSLSNYPATELMSTVLKKILNPYKGKSVLINEVIIGNVLSAGLGQNPARISAFKAGLNISIPAYTVNMVCGSSLKSVILGMKSIVLDGGQFVVTGGMENMSQAPHLLENHRNGIKFGHALVKDHLLHDGLYCSLINKPMIETADLIAEKFKITRLKQDKYALKSHKKAINATKSKRFEDEIIPITDQKTARNVLIKDEQPREDTNLTKLTNLKSIYGGNSTITAGNSSSINDGASAVILASEKFIKMNKIKPLAKIVDYSIIGLDPNLMGLGSYYAIKNLLKKTGLRKNDISIWEINEAFASQMIQVIDMLDIDENRINVNGGAIALGHPIGATGTRIVTTLVWELKKRQAEYGIAALCVGGGQGLALLLKNI